MGRELGRISGPLLADNLLRNGADLAFDDKVLYLDVTNGRVGFNTFAPTVELTVPTTAQTTNLIVDTQTNIGNFTVTTNNIQHITSGITLQPDQASNPNFVTPGLSTANLYFNSNILTNTVTNNPINIAPVGSGQVKLNSNTLVNGSLHAVGNITFDGNIQLGNETTDRITFASKVNSNILPAPASIVYNLLTQRGTLFTGFDDELLLIRQQYLYNLGSSSLKWNTLYANQLSSLSVKTSTITVSSVTAGGTTFGSNTIDNTSNNIRFSTLGTGLVKFNGVSWISDNDIQNKITGALTLASTTNGYIKFAGNKGVVISVGTDSDRPQSPQQGATRYNTQQQYIEAYSNSLGWIPAYGVASNATVAQVSDLSTLYSIVFGF